MGSTPAESPSRLRPDTRFVYPTRLHNLYSNRTLPGLSLIFLPAPLILCNPITTFISDAIFRRPLSPISHFATNDSLNQTLALSGVFSCAIGTAYSLAFRHGYDEWLYMSIPARLVVCALGHLVYLLAPEKTSPLLFVICIWDGVWAGLTAWAVRSVSGRVPEGYQRERKEL